MGHERGHLAKEAPMSGLFEKPILRPVGDRGLLVEYGDSIEPSINRKVRFMTLALHQEALAGVVEIIPAYRSLMIVYDPVTTSLERLERAIESLERSLDRLNIPPPNTVTIPVLYGGNRGPDIDFVATIHGLTVDDVIRIHSGATYQIYLIGFTPGFPFLGGLPEILHTPRLKTPRPVVPAGSVGIANNQTGVYPVECPGGWRLIGQTPLRLFDPGRKNPFLYETGDLIRFVPISEEEYQGLVEGRI